MPKAITCFVVFGIYFVTVLGTIQYARVDVPKTGQGKVPYACQKAGCKGGIFLSDSTDIFK